MGPPAGTDPSLDMSLLPEAWPSSRAPAQSPMVPRTLTCVYHVSGNWQWSRVDAPGMRVAQENGSVPGSSGCVLGHRVPVPCRPDSLAAEGTMVSVPTLIPTWVLWASARARRSLLPLLGPRKLLRNLVLYLRLSPHTPHCQACRLCSPGESSQVQRSMRPALQARASVCVRAAEDTAYRKAVSLKPVRGTRVGSGKEEGWGARSEAVRHPWTLVPVTCPLPLGHQLLYQRSFQSHYRTCSHMPAGR